jgi:hypothetical protein
VPGPSGSPERAAARAHEHGRFVGVQAVLGSGRPGFHGRRRASLRQRTNGKRFHGVRLPGSGTGDAGDVPNVRSEPVEATSFPLGKDAEAHPAQAIERFGERSVRFITGASAMPGLPADHLIVQLALWSESRSSYAGSLHPPSLEKARVGGVLLDVGRVPLFGRFLDIVATL